MLWIHQIQHHYLLKYIIIGDASVGKSNILLKYAHNQFKAEYQLTIGVEFGAKNIKIKDKIPALKSISLQDRDNKNYNDIDRGFVIFIKRGPIAIKILCLRYSNLICICRISSPNAFISFNCDGFN